MDEKGTIAFLSALLGIALLALGFVIAAPKVFPCADGIDNDSDGFVDKQDPGCRNIADKSELNEIIECDDGKDNDSDTLVDTRDTGCSSPTDTDETNCGDNTCEGGETSQTCPADCGNPDSCSDSDGGFVTSLQGVVLGYQNNIPYSHIDSCLGTNNTFVEEWSCNGTQAYSALYNCFQNQNATNATFVNATTQCMNGACV